MSMAVQPVEVRATVARGWTRILVVATLLILFGNLKSWWLGDSPAGGLAGVGLGVLLVVLMASYARWIARVNPNELGLGSFGLGRSLVAGLVAGVAVIAAALLAKLLAGPAAASGVASPLLAVLSPALLLRRVLLFLPFDTALPEEFAFRGVLQAELVRRLSPTPALLAGCVVFALWHVVLTLEEAGPQPLVVTGKLTADFIGGVLFALLRHKTGNLAGGITAHWFIDGGLMLVNA